MELKDLLMVRHRLAALSIVLDRRGCPGDLAADEGTQVVEDCERLWTGKAACQA
jgi:hypothetical protein